MNLSTSYYNCLLLIFRLQAIKLHKDEVQCQGETTAVEELDTQKATKGIQYMLKKKS